MRRHIISFVLLISIVAIWNRSEAQQVSASTPVKEKTQAAQRGTDRAQTKSEKAPVKSEDTKTKTDEAEGQEGDVQTATESPAKLESVPGGKALGMSVLGNQEAPKSLVIVPWKTSELGRAPGVAPMLDDSRQPIDREVFMRALRYYEIRSGEKP